MSKRLNSGESILMKHTPAGAHDDVIAYAHARANDPTFPSNSAVSIIAAAVRKTDDFLQFIGPNGWVNPRTANGQAVASKERSTPVADVNAVFGELVARSDKKCECNITCTNGRTFVNEVNHC